MNDYNAIVLERDKYKAIALEQAYTIGMLSTGRLESRLYLQVLENQRLKKILEEHNIPYKGD